MTEAAATQVRVMVVDDHEIVRQGLVSMIRRRPNLAVVAEAGSVEEAIRRANETRPDVIVMDVRLPDGTGIEACRDIRADLPDTKVIMLTSYSDEEAVFASIMAGASGFLLKQVRAEQIIDAINDVSSGRSILDPTVTQDVLKWVRDASGRHAPDPLEGLTEQERRILGLIADGKTNKEIAAEIFLSDKTVKNYVSSILSKLDLSRRSEAAAFFARLKNQPARD
jgi:DNA-binding NarL/FixJ family response regulator